jgi:hypothetical protein
MKGETTMPARISARATILTSTILALLGLGGCGSPDVPVATLEVRSAVIDGAMLGEVVAGRPLEVTGIRQFGTIEFRSADTAETFFSLSLCDPGGGGGGVVDPYGSLQDGRGFACDPTLTMCDGDRCAAIGDIDAEVIALGDGNLVSVSAVDVSEPNGAVHIEIEYTEAR